MRRLSDPVVDAPFARRRAYLDKLIADLELFSPDALAMASGYAQETGLHLPLIAVLHELREENATELGPQLRALRDEQVRRLRHASLAPTSVARAVRDGTADAAEMVVLCDAAAAARPLAQTIEPGELHDALARADLAAAGTAAMALRGSS